MNIKHVIWDWNGTLLNDRWLCVEGINAGLQKRGLPMITEKMYKEVFSFPVKEYYKKVGFDFSKEEFEIAGDEFVKFYGESFHKAKLHPKVPQVIKDIKNLSTEVSIKSIKEMLKKQKKETNENDMIIKSISKIVKKKETAKKL